MKRIIFPLAVSLCLLAVVSQHTTVVAKDTWVSVRTKNFFMLGDAGEKDIRKVALKLEQFREVFTRLFPKMTFNTPVPTTVIVFKSDSSYTPFKPRANTAGYFQAGPDVNYITLTTELRGEQDPFSVIFHEYTHLLVENTFDNAPIWFNEGLAEYYSTFSINDDQKVVLGRPIGTHVYLLRQNKMLPLQTLFEVDYKSPHYNETNKQGIFYAQSWALMHYLIIGKAGRLEQLGKFMELLTLKAPMERAFQEAFGVPFETMERDLRNYVKQDRYNITSGHFEKKLELDTTTEATVLTEAEAQAYLGDLLVHSHRKDAYTYLEKALKLDPNLAMAHASLGMAYFYEGKVKEAHASLERAVAASSKNYLAHYYYAFTLSHAGPDESPSSGGYSPEVAAKIREHLQKAITLRPDFPESYNLLAYVSLVTGDGIDDSISSLKQVLSASPGRHQFIYMLGQLYMRKGDYKTARELLEQVIKSNAEEPVRKHSESLLAIISNIEEQRTRYEAAKQAGSRVGQKPEITYGADPAPAQEAPPNDPSFYLREALRAPGAGETQAQATLVAIECGGKGMVFVVKTGAGLLRLRAGSFDDIELTTYDPSVKGQISCGPRKPEDSVIVCYVPNPDKKIKVDGVLKSIEFVPADFKLKP
ncbi:MAG TPA: tetratricopeptide repeat protein [Pyrinomonadaceae bacterium]|nr:tetratricopeptide repeat protein [Pyrinomonadaceae bacterium]